MTIYKQNQLMNSIESRIDAVLKEIAELESIRMTNTRSRFHLQDARVAMIKYKHDVVITRNQYENFQDLRSWTNSVIHGAPVV